MVGNATVPRFVESLLTFTIVKVVVAVTVWLAVGIARALVVAFNAFVVLLVVTFLTHAVVEVIITLAMRFAHRILRALVVTVFFLIALSFTHFVPRLTLAVVLITWTFFAVDSVAVFRALVPALLYAFAMMLLVSMITCAIVKVASASISKGSVAVLRAKIYAVLHTVSTEAHVVSRLALAVEKVLWASILMQRRTALRAFERTLHLLTLSMLLFVTSLALTIIYTKFLSPYS